MDNHGSNFSGFQKKMGQALKITYDPMANAMYIYFQEKLSVAYSKEVSDGVIVDFDEEGNPIGVEILRVSLRNDFVQGLKEIVRLLS